MEHVYAIRALDPNVLRRNELRTLPMFARQKAIFYAIRTTAKANRRTTCQDAVIGISVNLSTSDLRA